MWLIHMIYPFVWLFLNTAIVFLTDFKSDIYVDSLSANRAMFSRSTLGTFCEEEFAFEYEVRSFSIWSTNF